MQPIATVAGFRTKLAAIANMPMVQSPDALGASDMPDLGKQTVTHRDHALSVLPPVVLADISHPCPPLFKAAYLVIWKDSILTLFVFHQHNKAVLRLDKQ